MSENYNSKEISIFTIKAITFVFFLCNDFFFINDVSSVGNDDIARIKIL